jgi:hypothetical protein
MNLVNKSEAKDMLMKYPIGNLTKSAKTPWKLVNSAKYGSHLTCEALSLHFDSPTVLLQFQCYKFTPTAVLEPLAIIKLLNRIWEAICNGTPITIELLLRLILHWQHKTTYEPLIEPDDEPPNDETGDEFKLIMAKELSDTDDEVGDNLETTEMLHLYP